MASYELDNASTPLDRSLAILGYVASARRSVSIAEVAAVLDIPVPSAHRLIGNLEDRGMLKRAFGSKRIVIGNGMADLAAKAIGSTFRTASRHALLERASSEIGEQCEIGVVRGTHVVYVDAVRRAPTHGLQFDPGHATPIHCTSTGKIYMSCLPLKAREKLARSLQLDRYTPNTITDPDVLLKQLESIREDGWAKSNQEFVAGVVGCAVPIVGPGGV